MVGDPFDELPDDVIPKPLVSQDELKIELDPKQVDEIERSIKQRHTRVNRLLRRDLHREVALLYQFAESGAGSAAVRVASRLEADALRNKLYFARKQEQYRVDLIVDDDAAQTQRRRYEQLLDIALSCDVDERGFFLLLYRKSPLVLEPYELCSSPEGNT